MAWGCKGGGWGTEWQELSPIGKGGGWGPEWQDPYLAQAWRYDPYGGKGSQAMATKGYADGGWGEWSANAWNGSSGGSTSASSEKDSLVARVKGIQKNSVEGRSYWEVFCDAARTGNRDPIKHTEDSLRTFVMCHERGDTPEQAAACLGQIGDGRVLRLRGVPFQSDVLDVVGFLQEFRVDESQVTLGRSPEGRATGEAFVVFETAQLAEQALETKQKQEIKGRYIELFKSSHEEKDANTKISPTWSSGSAEKDDLIARVKVVQRSSRDGREKWEEYCDNLRTGSRDPVRHTTDSIRNFLDAYHKGEMPQISQPPETRVLRLRGVPFQCDLQDVLDFLADYGIDRSQAALGCSPDGMKPTGEAFVIFSDGQSAERALDERQRKEIKGRYIELFRSSEEEMHMATAARQRTNNVFGSDGSTQTQAEAMSKEELVARVKFIQRVDHAGKEMWYKYCEVSRTGNRDPVRHSSESLRNFVTSYNAGETPEQAAMKAAGDCRVLRLRGVPFQSDVLDVVEFLREYQVEELQVNLGRGENGRATGEAFVIFNSADLADRAMDEMQRKEIKGRYIELFRSSHEELEANTSIGTATESVTGDLEKDELVTRVKGIQRSSKDGREQWEKFCDALQTGSHDPVRQTSESIKIFLDAFHKGVMPELQPLPGSRVVRLRGIPFQSDISDVITFLKDFGIGRDEVLLAKDKIGKLTGEAYAFFASLADAELAMQTLQRKEIRGRYIELFRSSEEEMQQVKRIVDMAEVCQGGGGCGGDLFGGSGAYGAIGIGEAGKEDLVGRVKQIQRSSENGKQQWHDYCDALQVGNRDPNRHSKDSLRNFLSAYERGEAPEKAAAMGFGDGRVLRLRGVPFQSDVADVVDFFREYGVDAATVTMGRGSQGKMTGEAYVVFPSKEHAEAALATKQRQEIRGRYIELFRSSHEERDEAVAESVAESKGGLDGFGKGLGSSSYGKCLDGNAFGSLDGYGKGGLGPSSYGKSLGGGCGPERADPYAGKGIHEMFSMMMAKGQALMMQWASANGVNAAPCGGSASWNAMAGANVVNASPCSGPVSWNGMAGASAVNAASCGGPASWNGMAGASAAPCGGPASWNGMAGANAVNVAPCSGLAPLNAMGQW